MRQDLQNRARGHVGGLQKANMTRSPALWLKRTEFLHHWLRRDSGKVQQLLFFNQLLQAHWVTFRVLQDGHNAAIGGIMKGDVSSTAAATVNCKWLAHFSRCSRSV